MPVDKKGQVSVEFTLLLLISIAILGLFVAALNYMASTYDTAKDKKLELYSSSVLSEAAKDVCLSGDGSKRTIQLVAVVNNLSSEIPCDVDAGFPLKGRVSIENEDGRVKIAGV